MPGYLFRVLENKSNSFFQKAVGAGNLTTRQFGVLLTLHRHGPITQTELADRTSSDRSSLGEMVGRMIDRGLLTKEGGKDRRSNMVSITSKGEKTLVDMMPIVCDVQNAILEVLPEEYRMLFLKCLGILKTADFEKELA